MVNPTPPPNGPGWFGDILRDPAAALAHLGAFLQQLWVEQGRVLGPALVAVLAVMVIGWRWWRRRCHHRMCTDARLITVLPPSQVDPAGGEALWANLVGLLRPAWRRRVFGQPHLGFEYLFSPDGVQIRVWVPGAVPPGLVERAIQAAWPGAHTHSAPATPTTDTSTDTTAATTATTIARANTTVSVPMGNGGGHGHVVVGGRLQLARGDALPIRTAFDADPLRALLGAPLELGRGEWACVQVLARPIAGSRLVRDRRHTSNRRGGGTARLIFGLLDGVTGLLTGHPAHPRTPGTRPDPQAALTASALNRATVAKQHGALYATAIHYAVATRIPTAPRKADNTADGAGPVQMALRRGRGRAHTLAAAFATYTGHNRYRRTRLRHPTPALASRWLGRGDLLSVPELAVLAHLPLDAFVPGLQRAGARALAPPPAYPPPGMG
jgi:hypothetical protein